MRIDHRYTVQTIPAIRWRGLFASHGQVCPAKEAEVYLYTALAYDGTAWYTNIVGEEAKTEVEIESEGFGGVPLGFGYGRWTVLKDGRCERDGAYVTLGEWLDMRHGASAPGIGDLPVPVLYAPAKDGAYELYDVASKSVRKFRKLDIPLLTDPGAASSMLGDAALSAWRKDFASAVRKAFVGFPSRRVDAVEHTSLPAVMYSCRWSGKPRDNGLFSTVHLLAKYL